MSPIRIFGDGTSTIYQLLEGQVPSPVCGGNGTCGKCRVRPHGDVSKPSASEERLLSREDLASGTRLACLCVPRGECLVDMQETVAFFRNRQRLRRPGDSLSAGEGYGVAVDIGTTTCVMDLIDLATGKVLARETFLNAQRAWGTDVLARVQASSSGHAEDLRIGDSVWPRTGSRPPARARGHGENSRLCVDCWYRGNSGHRGDRWHRGVRGSYGYCRKHCDVSFPSWAGCKRFGYIAFYSCGDISYLRLELLGDLLGAVCTRCTRLSNCVVQIVPGISAFHRRRYCRRPCRA